MTATPRHRQRPQLGGIGRSDVVSVTRFRLPDTVSGYIEGASSNMWKNFPLEICTRSAILSTDCGTYWSAWSAIATGVAALIALVAVVIALLEGWFRRRKEAKARRDVIREVCSAVDQILAYHELAITLANGGFPFLESHQSFRQIHENAITLRDALAVLQVRSELTDGAIYSAIAVQRIAAPLIVQTLDPEHVGNWPDRVARLEPLLPIAQVVRHRVDGVRKYAKLGPSSAAKKIRDKYQPFIAEMERAQSAKELPNIPSILRDQY